MSPAQIGFAILVLGAFLIIGKLVRVKVRWVQRLFLPSSIVAGALLLVLGPQVLGKLAGGPLAEAGIFTPQILEVWGALPGLLISVVFATMFLGQDLPRLSRAVTLVGPQLSLGVALGSGQYVVGLLLAILVLVPFFSATPMVGALIEVGFEGGHGTAAGMRETFQSLGFDSGADLAVGLATVGIVGGIVIGIGLINWGARTGRTEFLSGQVSASVEEQRGLFRRDEYYPAATMTSRPASVEPLALHVAICAIAILVGWAILEALRWIESATYGTTEIRDGVTLEIFGSVPLFPLALLGGVIVQAAAKALKVDHLIDHQMMLRIQGLALDFLIVSAIATLSITAIGENLATFLLLAAAGIAFTVSVFYFFAPKVIGRFWFERAIGDFGQSMGVTATGLILMRIVDPEAKSPAFEAFGYKQLVFEPFFGGGLVTAMAVPIIFFVGPWPLLIGMGILFLVSTVGGILAFGPTARREHRERAAELQRTPA
ncbi:sodium:glutamate symporter [Zhihengliuella sp.]|uniref:sodium/glutamate symporter n=1 Tax=Zhihengliuella sp. TaxID=1954483 RepID=UPI0028118AC3|nr:sodium:glutamate symporter [Zhihengliuella sp.]